MACYNGHIDTARMLLGEFHAEVDIQNTVRAIVRLFCVVMCEHVFSGCARGGGGWECGRCRGYWHIFGFHICHPNLNHLFYYCTIVLGC